MADTFKFNLNKTLLLSALLHAGFFIAAIAVSMKTVRPVPIGVEFTYQAAPQSPPPMAPAATVAAALKKAAPSRINPDDIVTKKSTTPAAAQESVAAPTSAPVAPTASVVTGPEGVANGSQVTPEDRYLYELKKLLERRKSYPNLAKKMGHAGTVTMRFTLKADGSLAHAEVVEKAAYETLNQAAVTLVQGIDGLKPFPQEIHRDTWSITVPIEYKLN